MQLYELRGKDPDVRFSPYVWRIKMAMKHKGLEWEPVPLTFLDKEPYAPSGSKTVPVLKDDDTWVSDSWDIAVYLEDNFRGTKPLFGDGPDRQAARFFHLWADTEILTPLFLTIVADLPRHFTDEDAAYFVESREKRIRMKLEDTIDMRDTNIARMQANLRPAKTMLRFQDFLCGKEPAYLDYALFGAFQWARLASEIEVLDGMPEMIAWRGRMLELFDGYAAKAKVGWQNLPE